MLPSLRYQLSACSGASSYIDLRCCIIIISDGLCQSRVGDEASKRREGELSARLHHKVSYNLIQVSSVVSTNMHNGINDAGPYSMKEPVEAR